MNTAHELLERLQVEGAGHFASTGLAQDHSSLARRVRRDRAVRTSALSVAGLAIAGVAAVGIANLGSTSLDPAVTPSVPSDPFSPSPYPSTLRHSFTLSVSKQERIEEVASQLATQFLVGDDVALNAIVNALPPEANGDPEGWVASGEHQFLEEVDQPHGLQNAADQLVGVQVQQLESEGVPRDQWHRVVVLASILQYEAPAGPSDQGVVARVLVNRIEQGMPLQIDSVPESYQTLGLPKHAIGAFTPEVLAAAIQPPSRDWLYFLRKDDGNVLPFTTYADFAAAAAAEGD